MSNLTIFTDGGARGNPGPAAIGFQILDSDNKALAEIGSYLGVATNNEAEYQAIIASLEWLLEHQPSMTITKITWKLDSMLVVEQLSRHWKIKEPRLRDLAQKAWGLLEKLGVTYSLGHVPRAQNKRADELVNQALDAAAE